MKGLIWLSLTPTPYFVDFFLCGCQWTNNPISTANLPEMIAASSSSCLLFLWLFTACRWWSSLLCSPSDFWIAFLSDPCTSLPLLFKNTGRPGMKAEATGSPKPLPPRCWQTGATRTLFISRTQRMPGSQSSCGACLSELPWRSYSSPVSPDHQRLSQNEPPNACHHQSDVTGHGWDIRSHRITMLGLCVLILSCKR